MQTQTGKVLTSEDAVAQYGLLRPLLISFHSDVMALSKKKQDGVVNKLKVTMINKVLTRIKTLQKAEPTAEFIELLDDETLPSNSDAVLILSQFQTAMDQFYGKYYRKERSDTERRWHTIENP